MITKVKQEITAEGTDNQSILLFPRGNDVNSYIQKMKRRVIMQKHEFLHIVFPNLVKFA